MSYEEEFDKIIRNKADELDFPFDEGNWEKASRMLDADRVKTPVGAGARSYWTSVVVSIAGVAIVIAVLGSYLDIRQEEPNSVAINSNVAPAKSQPSVEASISELRASEKVSGEVNQKPSPAITTEVKEPVAEKVIQIKAEETPARINAVAEAGNAGNNNQSPAREENNNKDQDPSNAKAMAGGLGAGIASAKNNADAPSTPPATMAEEPSVPANDKDAAIVEDNEQSAAPEAIAAENMQSINGQLVNEPTSAEATPSFNYVTLYDDYYKKRGMVTQFGVEGGTAWMSGWSTPQGTDGRGWNWYAGATINTQFSGRFGVASGFQVYNLAHVTQPFYAVQGKDYHFGSTQTGTTITSSNLLYVAIPLQVTYRLSNVNLFGLGVNAGYLSGASNSVRTYSVLDNVVTPVSDETDKGVYNGVRPFNLMLNASFTTRICPRFALKAEFNYGLTDLFANNATVRNAERATGVRVGIRYTFLGK